MDKRNHTSDVTELQLCVLCTKPLQRPGVDVYYVSGCNHVFCQECKQDSLFCVNPYFLHQSLKGDAERQRVIDGKVRTSVGFRCMVCLNLYAKHHHHVSQAPLVTPTLNLAPKRVLQGHIATQTTSAEDMHGSLQQLVCTDHKTGFQEITRYCRTCRMPLCKKCHRSHDPQHSIEPIGAAIGDYARHLVSIQAALQQHIAEQAQHKERLARLRSEQQSSARRNQSDIRRHVTSVINMVQKAGDALIAELDDKSRQQQAMYDNALKLCEYSTRNARKLRALCDTIQQYPLLVNYPTIEKRTSALLLYSQASANNTTDMRRLAYEFKPTLAIFDDANQFSIGSLQQKPIEETELNGSSTAHAQGVPGTPTKTKVKASVEERLLQPRSQPQHQTQQQTQISAQQRRSLHTAHNQVPETPASSNHHQNEPFFDLHLPTISDNVTRTPPPSHPSILSQNPLLKWRHCFADGFDQNKRNPNLQGVHFLPDERLLVAYDRGVYCFHGDGQLQSKFEHRTLLQHEECGRPPKSEPEILWPQCFTNYDAGHVAFTDRQQMTVYLYTVEGRFKHMMRPELFRQKYPTRGGGDDRRYEATAPFGIVRLSSGLLAVSDKLQQTIHFLDPTTEQIVLNITDGGHGNGQLQAPTFLALDHHRRLLVSDSGSSYVKLYSCANGKYIGRLNALSNKLPPSTLSPYDGLTEPGGIVVDPNNGDQIIANHNPGHSLLHLSPRGEYLETLQVRDGRKTSSSIPFGLALGRQGQLAMTHKLDGALSVVQLYE